MLIIASLAALAAAVLIGGATAGLARSRRGGAAAPTPPQRPQPILAMAERMRAGLDRNADMAAACWHARVTPDGGARRGRQALLDELFSYCQHSVTPADMYALADAGSSLSQEFGRWLGADLAHHVEQRLVPDAGPMPALDARLAAHARRHGWLTPSTLALARGGSPASATRAGSVACAMAAGSLTAGGITQGITQGIAQGIGQGGGLTALA